MNKEILYKIAISRYTVCLVSMLWLIFQCMYIYKYHYETLMSDQGLYVYYATECYQHGTIYPDYSQFNNQYIFNPGWINFIVAWLNLFGSVKYLPLFNVLLNAGIVTLIFKIAQILSEDKIVAYLSVYVFMLLPSNFTIVIHLLSELQFEFLTLLSIYLVLCKNKFLSVFAGTIIALAIWTRPIAIAWICATIIYYFNKKFYLHILYYIIGYVCVCISISLLTHKNFPDYVWKASTGGVNLIMGANDLATGGYCGEARREGGLGYLPNLFSDEELPVLGDHGNYKKTSGKYTYKECDSIWTKRAVEWIKANPSKFTKLMYIKVKNLYSDAPEFVYSGYFTMQSSLFAKMCKLVGKWLFYPILLIYVLGSCFYGLRKEEYIILIIPVMLCTIMVALTVGMDRYNFPLLPYIVLCVSAYIVNFYHNIRAYEDRHSNLS